MHVMEKLLRDIPRFKGRQESKIPVAIGDKRHLVTKRFMRLSKSRLEKLEGPCLVGLLVPKVSSCYTNMG